jgi:DNA-binding transcriptional regulator YiaG
MRAARSDIGIQHAKSKRRTQLIDRKSWRFKRIAFFQRNVRFAASAKAYRTAMDVTQEEVAAEFDVNQTCVGNWESGKYSWPGDKEELAEYIKVINGIVRRG